MSLYVTYMCVLLIFSLINTCIYYQFYSKTWLMIMGSVKMLFLKHFHTQFSADKNDFENVESVTSTCIYKERRAIYIYFHTEIIHGI